MKVSFITVAFRSPELIRNLLKGIEQANFQFPFEYIVVDNGGGGVVEMVREKFPWVKIISGHGNVGFAAGNNLGFKQATGEYIMLMNPDTTVFPQEMEKLVAHADANPDIGLVIPKLMNPNGTVQTNVNRFPSLMIPVYRRTFLGKTSFGKRAVDAYFMRDLDLTKPIDVDGAIGAAILIRQSALKHIGYFDETYWMYFEDIDLCRRAWENGWRVNYFPDVRIVHYHQRESRIKWPWEILTNRPSRAHIASALHYFRKYHGKSLPR